MPDYKPNYILRVVAVLALVGAVVLVVAVIATSHGGSSDDTASKTETTRTTKNGQRAVREGVWIVRSGDTLGRISVVTGIDIEELEQLNPDLDPQTLQQGERIVLR